MSDVNQSQELFRNAGYCHCCRTNTEFVAYSPWLRDYYVCGVCMSSPRQRHLQYVLDTFFPGWEGLAVHESSPSNKAISQYCSNYSCSQYFPGVEPGLFVDGVRCENIEQLSFKNATLDLFITMDVLEHVFDPAKAIREITRVLKNGGAHVFTTPKRRDLLTTRQRASVGIDGVVKHLHEPEYHENPVGDGRALVTFDFGADLEDLLSQWSARSVQTFHTVDRNKGLDGEFCEVFVIRA